MISYILTLDKQLLYQLLFQLLNTIVLCGLLSLILYKPIIAFLNKRKENIENKIKDANSKFSEADTLKFEYETKLADIEKERNLILEEARLRAKENETFIIAEAKKEAETIKNRAILDIEREKEKVKDEIKSQIIEVSSLIVSKFITKNIDSSEQDKLVDEAIKDLEEVKWQN